jgi:hypothetical protein
MVSSVKLMLRRGPSIRPDGYATKSPALVVVIDGDSGGASGTGA